MNETVAVPELEALIAEAEKEGGFTFGQEGLEYKDYLRKLNAGLKGKLPENTEIFFERAPQAKSITAGRIPYLLEIKEQVGGENLTNAEATFSNNIPVVLFKFNAKGTKPFAQQKSWMVNHLHNKFHHKKRYNDHARSTQKLGS